jgi:hypothetical protein
MLALTIKYSAKDLGAFSITFFIYFFAYSSFAYVVFGPYVGAYQSLMASIASHFRFSLGQYDFQSLIDANYVLGAVYFVSFIFIVFMGLMSMFVAILTDAFEQVKEDVANMENDFEIFHYVADKFKKDKKKTAKINANAVNEETLNVIVKETIKQMSKTDFVTTEKLQFDNYPKADSKRRLPPIDEFKDI